MIKIISFFLIIFQNQLFAQYFTIYKHKESVNKKYEYTFPLIVNKLHPEIAEKINKKLQMSVLNKVITPGKVGAFQHFFNENDGKNFSARVYDFSHEIYRNDSVLLIINFDYEHCGGSCGFIHLKYNFNAKSGECLDFKGLFNKNNFLILDILIISEITKQIKSRIASLKKELKLSKKQNEIETIKNNINEYEECKNMRLNYPYHYKMQKDTSFYYVGNQIELNEKKIWIDAGSCQKHLDGLGCALNPTDFQDCIKTEHLKLFGLERPEIKNQTIYSGKLNEQFEIVMLITEFVTGEKRGFYFYKSQGLPIKLTYSIENQHVILGELDSNNRKIAFFKLTETKEGYSGTWNNAVSTKIFPVVLLKNKGLVYEK